MSLSPMRALQRVYGLLLRAYPAQVRDEFGAEMEAVFAQAAARALDRGWPPLILLCWRELRDWPAAVVRAHRDRRLPQEVLLMDSVRRSGPPRSGWPFYTAWIAATVASLPIAGAIGFVIIQQAVAVLGGRIEVGGQSHITEDYLYSWVFFSMFGLVMGVLQYLLLRGRVPRAGWWIGATVIGWGVLPRLLGAVVPAEVTSAPAPALAAALLGGLVALPQWWLLRRWVRQAGWWLVANCLGWSAVGLITGPAIMTSLDVAVAAIIPALAAGVALWLLLDRLPRRASGTASRA
jgi:hypothetical protein